jgi:ribosomal protein S18 acetylase RimI-like enzyme
VWRTQEGSAAGYTVLNFGATYAALICETPLDDAGLLDDMIASGVETCARTYRGGADALTTSLPAGAAAKIAAFERAGFSLLPEDSVLYLQRDLAEPIAPAALPPGYTARGLRGADEADAWVALHRAAFGTENMTLEYKLVMMRQPDYDPKLDLVAVAPDGSLAAYVVASIDRELIAASGIQAGFTDPVATHPAHQRRGLARALLLTVLELLRRRGMEIVRLSTASDNIAMQAAAHSAGYRAMSRGLRFARPLTETRTV